MAWDPFYFASIPRISLLTTQFLKLSSKYRLNSKPPQQLYTKSCNHSGIIFAVKRDFLSVSSQKSINRKWWSDLWHLSSRVIRVWKDKINPSRQSSKYYYYTYTNNENLYNKLELSPARTVFLANKSVESFSRLFWTCIKHIWSWWENTVISSFSAQ